MCLFFQLWDKQCAEIENSSLRDFLKITTNGCKQIIRNIKLMELYLKVIVMGSQLSNVVGGIMKESVT